MASLPEQRAGVVVEHDGEVVGFALGQSDRESGAELNAIHVLPERQGTGAGQALMDVVVEAFREWGVSDAHLHVIEGNERAQARARSFRRRSGGGEPRTSAFQERQPVRVPFGTGRSGTASPSGR